jgi:hypothetical protein
LEGLEVRVIELQVLLGCVECRVASDIKLRFPSLRVNVTTFINNPTAHKQLTNILENARFKNPL